LADVPIPVQGRLLPSIVSEKSSSARRLFSNSAAMAIANLAGRGLGYAYIILMARKLDPRYLGAYAVLVTTSLLIELVSNLGLDKILVREITKGTAEVGQGFFLAALPVRLAMALPTAACAWLLLHAFFSQRLFAPFWCVAIYLCAIFPVVAARNCEAFLTAHERMLPVAISQACERVIIFIAVLALVSGQMSFAGILCIVPVASFIRFIIVASATWQLWHRNLRSLRPPVRSFLQQAVELLSVEILALVYFRSDTFLVARMNGLASAGIYQITYKIFDLCISLFAGFLQAVFPRMVRDRSRASLLKILAMGMAALLVPASIIILARGFILGSIHPEYLAGSTSLIWLMLTVPLVYTTSTLANAAIAAGHVRILIVCAVGLIVTNVGMNMILIPKYAINGAAFSTFACELLSVVLLGPFIFFKSADSKGAA
jgi:O-antigen/teichoic acid export membrane protein